MTIAPEAIAEALAEDLREAGFVIHDCDGPGRVGGGVCLTSKPDRSDGSGGPDDYPAGVIVSWTCADDFTVGQERVADVVRVTMIESLRTILAAFGYPLIRFSYSGVPLVTGLAEGAAVEAAG
jgi:hypothetical protein